MVLCIDILVIWIVELSIRYLVITLDVVVLLLLMFCQTQILSSGHIQILSSMGLHLIGVTALSSVAGHALFIMLL